MFGYGALLFNKFRQVFAEFLLPRLHSFQFTIDVYGLLGRRQGLVANGAVTVHARGGDADGLQTPRAHFDRQRIEEQACLLGKPQFLHVLVVLRCQCG